MGTGASSSRSKTIFLDVDGKQTSVVFSRLCSSQELRELLASAAGVSKWTNFSLLNQSGSLVAVSPSMPQNTARTPYQLRLSPDSQGDTQVFNEVLTKISDEFSKAFQIREFTSDFSTRLSALEKQLEVEALKAVEIDSCRKELALLKDQLTTETLHHRADAIALSRVRKNVPLYPKYILSEETVKYLKKPTFDIWHWEHNEMLSLLEHMYNELDLITELHINPITLRRWLLEVQENYRNNPFHNFRHCFCVAQMMYGMIHLLDLPQVFSKLELATLITAAICHDIDHPGFNNNYQINARTELAIRYNDISPLENHHCAVAFQILEKPDMNIFAFLSTEDYRKIRSGMIMLILATDMARHSEIMESFRGITNDFDCNNDDHRSLFKKMLIKACDISNEVRPTEIAEPWVDCLLEEYFLQSDREKSEGLPVAPFMDRDKVTKPTAQIGFIKFVLIPMFEALNNLFPQLEEPMLVPLRNSLEHYERLKMVDDFNQEESSRRAEMSKMIPGESNANKKETMIAVPLSSPHSQAV